MNGRLRRFASGTKSGLQAIRAFSFLGYGIRWDGCVATQYLGIKKCLNRKIRDNFLSKKLMFLVCSCVFFR